MNLLRVTLHIVSSPFYYRSMHKEILSCKKRYWFCFIQLTTLQTMPTGNKTNINCTDGCEQFLNQGIPYMDKESLESFHNYLN